MNFKYLVTLGLGLFFVACASTQPQRPVGFEAYDTAVVNVTTNVAESDEEAQTLQNMLVEALNERHVFQSVRTAAAENARDSLLIQVTITRLIRVNTTLRIAMGSVAGSNELGVDVTLTDGKTQQVLSGFHLRSESPEYPPGSDWPWGSIEIAMERLNKQLVKILSDWKQTTSLEK